MSTCNYCSLQSIRRDAKKNNKRVVLIPSVYELGGTEVYVLKPREKPNNKSWACWFMSIPEQCVLNYMGVSMNILKKVWITKHDGGMVELSLQGEHDEPKGMRVKVQERFGKDMHKVILGLLSVNDLDLIVDAIEEYFIEREKI